MGEIRGKPEKLAKTCEKVETFWDKENCGVETTVTVLNAPRESYSKEVEEEF